MTRWCRQQHKWRATRKSIQGKQGKDIALELTRGSDWTNTPLRQDQGSCRLLESHRRLFFSSIDLNASSASREEPSSWLASSAVLLLRALLTAWRFETVKDGKKFSFAVLSPSLLRISADHRTRLAAFLACSCCFSLSPWIWSVQNERWICTGTDRIMFSSK